MNCLFCAISKKEIKSNILLENEKSMAILDVNPISKGHTILISKNHAENITELIQEDWNSLFPLLKEVVQKIRKKFKPHGFNFINNMGEISYQSIFHFHLHIIPKYEKNQGFIWNTKLNSSEENLEKIHSKLKF